MAKFKITFKGSPPKKEDVDADDFIDEGNEGEWITFRRHPGGRNNPTSITNQVLRVRAASVNRIDRIAE
jgi:hypothetical protein